MTHVLIVAATRYDQAGFEASTYLSASLKRLAYDPNLQASIIGENRQGLPTIYNSIITEANRDKVAVFTHDDVYIDDFFLKTRLEEALQRFEIVGLAGNKRRVPRQPAWGFVTDNPQFQWDEAENLSGAVAHFQEGRSVVSSYGPTPAQCQLLDGVFLAAKVGVLLDRSVRFDERFAFHFYDMDFCRTAVNAGLLLGTWPIAVTHASGGAFGTLEWMRYRELYFMKWNE